MIKIDDDLREISQTYALVYEQYGPSQAEKYLEKLVAEVGSRLSSSSASAAVIAERQRQVTKEGWSTAHDDEHVDGEIATFAAAYALPPDVRDRDAGYGFSVGDSICPNDWHLKPCDRRRELVKAGALILAEIERLDRAAARKREA